MGWSTQGISPLTQMHLSEKKIENNDQVSADAFKAYLERIDYGKQFLTTSDVKTLEKFKTKMDDMFLDGNLDVLDVTSELMNKRIGQIEKHVEKLLDQPLDYKKKDFIETDPKKRKFATSEKELFSHWERLMKFEVESRIIDQREEQSGLATDEKGNKKKPVSDKKLSEAEIEKEARSKVLKS